MTLFQAEGVAGELDACRPGFILRVLLALVALHQRDADHEHRDADMRDHHAVVRAGLPEVSS